MSPEVPGAAQRAGDRASSGPDPTGGAGRVVGLHRFPVKSILGEPLAEVTVDRRGVAGDRTWAVRDGDGKLGSGKSTRRFRRMDGLLQLGAAYDAAANDNLPIVSLPDGARLRADDPQVHEAVSRHVGRPVRLEREAEVSHFDEGPVHLVTTASLQTLARAHGRPVDERRTRANVVVAWDGEGFPEHAWLGREVHLGEEVTLRILDVMPRCVMVTLPQGDLDADPRLLHDITDLTEGALGVVADVQRTGVVRLQDPVYLATD